MPPPYEILSDDDYVILVTVGEMKEKKYTVIVMDVTKVIVSATQIKNFKTLLLQHVNAC